MIPIYQIVNLGSPQITSSSELGIQDERVSVVELGKQDSNYPCIYLYWGLNEDDKQNKSGLYLEKLVYDNKVLPIVVDNDRFNDCIPEDLHKINAFVWESNNPSKLGTWVLKYFLLIECTNKVFISYKRTDTSRLAHQLFEELIKSRYSPFLDCYSIESGVDFQEYLRNEVADCDVFIYLNSQNYNESDFTKEERECAQKLSIGIVQVVFDKVPTDNTVFNSALVRLQEEAEPEKSFAISVIRKIINTIEEKRAMMFEYRRKALINSYRILHKNDNFRVIENGTIENTSKQELLSIVCRVPNSYDFQKADNCLSPLADSKTYTKRLLFDSQFVRRDILNHLNWLNSSLPVKIFDINE